jgi:hypothetical protein
MVSYYYQNDSHLSQIVGNKVISVDLEFLLSFHGDSGSLLCCPAIHATLEEVLNARVVIVEGSVPIVEVCAGSKSSSMKLRSVSLSLRTRR